MSPTFVCISQLYCVNRKATMTRPGTRSLHVYVVKLELDCIVNSCIIEVALQIVQ